jgi:hypothetical protein
MERASTTGCESSTDYNCLCNSSAYTNSVGVSTHESESESEDDKENEEERSTKHNGDTTRGQAGQKSKVSKGRAALCAKGWPPLVALCHSHPPNL